MKAVLISIKPKWVELIASGKKTIEVRKTRPKLETPFKCYIYQSGKNLTSTVYGSEFSKSGYVIGEFVCDKIFDVFISCSDPNIKGHPFPGTGLTDMEIMDYLGNGVTGYGWHICALKIYDKPLSLSDFRSYNTSTYIENGFPMPTKEIKSPPMSWRYLEELTNV